MESLLEYLSDILVTMVILSMMCYLPRILREELKGTDVIRLRHDESIISGCSFC